MESDVSLIISAVVTAFVQVIKGIGVGREKGIWMVTALSALGVLIYGFSYEPVFVRSLVWEYFAAFGNVLLAAMGIYGLIQKSGEMVTDLKGAGTSLKQSLTGTGSGKE